jgi:hypothetical protein
LPWTRLWQKGGDPEELIALECAEMFGELRLVAWIGDLRLGPARFQNFPSNGASLQDGDVAYVHE